MDSSLSDYPQHSPDQLVLLNLGGAFQSPGSFEKSACPIHAPGQLSQCLGGTLASVVYKASQLIPVSSGDWKPQLQNFP